MKSNPLLIACTFMLGCLVALVALNTFAGPASAQGTDSANGTSAGDALGDIKAISVQADSNKEVLVVFRKLENSALTKGPAVGMAVYEFVSKGNGKIDTYLVGTRHLDYDLMIPEFINKKGEVIRTSEVKKEHDDWVKDEAERAEKEAKKNKK